MTGPTKLVLATSNANKARELKSMLGPAFEILTLADLDLDSPEETGDSFLDNALLKARYASELSGLPAIGDDSGLEVDALDGEPGIHSARFAGPEATDSDNVAKLLDRLQQVPTSGRSAHFRCVLVFVHDGQDPAPVIADASWDGGIASAPRGEFGFGYDPVFIVDASGTTAAELTPEAKNRASHRGRALRLLTPQLTELFA